MSISIIVLIVMLLGCSYFMWRNLAVYEERTRVLKTISRLAQEDILSGRDWLKRYEYYDQVSYSSMLLKFWKSVGSFYST